MRKRIFLANSQKKTIVTWLRIRKIMSYVREVIWSKKLIKTRMVIRIRVKTRNSLLFKNPRPACSYVVFVTLVCIVLTVPGFLNKKESLVFSGSGSPSGFLLKCSVVIPYEFLYYCTGIERETSVPAPILCVVFNWSDEWFIQTSVLVAAGIGAGTGTRCCLQLVHTVECIN
jgi:hypothetical protein